MQIYLPIAEISVNIFLLLGLGGGIGVLSGLFGVGGGFLLTPLLIVIGIPPSVAVATGANQIVASSVAGVLSHWRRGNVDVKMGILLLLGGLAGSSIGVGLFSLLRRLGQIDLFVALAYVLLLGAIGGLMFVEGWQSLNRSKRAAAPRRKMHQHTWLHGLPLKMRFRKSRLYRPRPAADRRRGDRGAHRGPPRKPPSRRKNPYSAGAYGAGSLCLDSDRTFHTARRCLRGSAHPVGLIRPSGPFHNFGMAF